MKLYVVTADTYNDPYGSEISLLRVTANKSLAEESVKYGESKKWFVNMDEVEEGEELDVYLGGYYE